MINLVALSPEDGWAFAHDDGQLVQLRPPYDEARPASEVDVVRSLGMDGFEARNREFRSWRELIAFLRQEIQRTRAADITPEEQARELVRFLESADEDVLLGFLDRIEREYVAAGNHSQARSAIEAMQQVDRLWTAGPLRRRALEVTNRLPARQVDDAIDFPSVSEDLSKYCSRRQPGSSFAYAA